MTATPRKSTFTKRDAAPPPEEPLEGLPPQGVALSVLLKQRLAKAGQTPRGRPKGAKSKIPTELRSAILNGGALAGYDVIVQEMVDKEMAQIELEDPVLAKAKGLREKIEKHVRTIAQGDLTDYLRHHAQHNPTAFMSLLGRVLPRQVDFNVQLTSRQVLEEMSERRNQLAELRYQVVEAAKGVDYHAEDDG